MKNNQEMQISQDLYGTRLFQAILREGTRVVEGLLNDDAVVEAVWGKLVKIPIPQNQKFSVPRDQVFEDLFNKVGDILSSFEVLSDCSVYVRRFPFPNTTVDRGRYLNTHISLYFNECYRLKERLKALSDYICKVYYDRWNRESITDFREALDVLFSDTIASNRNARDLRNRDVHVKHFHDTEPLDKAWFIERLDVPYREILKTIHLSDYKLTRKRWSKTIVDKRKSVAEFVCSAFNGGLADACVDPNGRLRRPLSE